MIRQQTIPVRVHRASGAFSRNAVTAYTIEEGEPTRTAAAEVGRLAGNMILAGAPPDGCPLGRDRLAQRQ